MMNFKVPYYKSPCLSSEISRILLFPVIYRPHYNLHITGIRTILTILANLNDLAFTELIHNSVSNKTTNVIDSTEQNHSFISEKCSFHEIIRGNVY
jgi:hypothetical protein